MNQNTTLKGVYTEIKMDDDLVLNHDNFNAISYMVFSHLDMISRSISHLSFSGLFHINNTVTGCQIKDALSHLLILIKKSLKPNMNILITLEKLCIQTSQLYGNMDELKRIFRYFIMGIKNELILHKIPCNKAILLNIKDIDPITFRKVPKNVLAIVLEPHSDISIQDYLGKKKVHYVLANKPLKINELYEIDMDRKHIKYPQM